MTLTVSNSIGSNTTTQVVNISLPTAPVINGANICSGQSATLSGSVASGNSIVWYNASGSTPIDTALNFTTPVLSSSTSYRAENVQFFPPQNVGPTNGQIGAGGHLNSATAFQLNFEAYKAFTLVSVWVDAALPGSRTINVYNAYNGGGTIVATVNAIIPTGQTRVQLDIVIPGPGQYSIGMANANLYRNTAGVNYPYDISGLVSINGSSTGTSNYYYLYDWEVQEAPCRSPMVTVPVTVNAANFSSVQTGLSLQLTDLSTGASSWLWNFGDGNTSTTQNPSHTYATPGTYTVTLTVNGNTGCPKTTTYSVFYTAVTQSADQLEVSLLPNPAKTKSTLNFGQALTEDLQVQIIAVDGRVIRELLVRKGESTQTLDVEDLAPAMYLIRLNNTTTTQTLKLTVE